MEPKVYINGKLYPKEEAKVSVFDHGLLYGDGVFEGIRCYNGNCIQVFRTYRQTLRFCRGNCLGNKLTRDELKNAVLDTLKLTI